MPQAYEERNKAELPAEIKHVMSVLDDLLFHGYKLTHKTVFSHVNKKYVKYVCNVKTNNINNSIKEFISRWGLTIRILSDQGYTVYEVYCYPNSKSVTTEKGESLKDALKFYFKEMINWKIKYYKRLRKSLKEK